MVLLGCVGTLDLSAFKFTGSGNPASHSPGASPPPSLVSLLMPLAHRAWLLESALPSLLLCRPSHLPLLPGPHLISHAPSPSSVSVWCGQSSTARHIMLGLRACGVPVAPQAGQSDRVTACQPCARPAPPPGQCHLTVPVSTAHTRPLALLDQVKTSSFMDLVFYWTQQSSCV